MRICLPVTGGDCAQAVEQLLLQRRVQVRVGLVEQQDVEVGIGREREDAEPLQEAAALDHEVAVRCSRGDA